MKRSSVLVVISLALSAILPGWVAPLQAAATPKGQNITASPTQIMLSLDPGSSTSSVATVINDGDQAYDFKAYSTPYRVSGEQYDQSFVAAEGTVDTSSWIHLTNKLIHLEPHVTTTVPYTITIPKGTGGGGYYGTIFFETIAQQIAGSGLATRQRVGLVVYLRVNGAVIEHGTVESFTVPFFHTAAPVTAVLRLGNQGNVHYAADVTEHVTDLFGNGKFDLHLEREVLPGTTRRIELTWKAAPSFGLFKVSGVVNMLGRTETLPVRLVLILSPLAIIAALAAVLVLIGLLIWWWRGRRSVRHRGV